MCNILLDFLQNKCYTTLVPLRYRHLDNLTVIQGRYKAKRRLCGDMSTYLAEIHGGDA